ncbi:MAG: 3-keto-5-aminohexanoate cleavage protein, partial [Bacteroidales bacterium]|nr:3-keto-5-aminohexanoate cleavage protein [Bacteroidales bacterium]
IKPEYECFEMGHLETIVHMARKGQVPSAFGVNGPDGTPLPIVPMQFNFVLGVLGCASATVDNLVWMAKNIPAGSTWTSTGIGRHAFTLAAPTIVMGGNVRVGFEDNLYLERGVLAKSNGELVDKVVRMAKLLGRPIATSDEAREILGLKK